jgi:ligand-binding SRPBCC domain-containing protein
MKTYQLIRAQHLPVEPEMAWYFFSNPANLRLITPPWLDFTITSQLPDTIYAGLIITYRIRPAAGIGVPWVSEISQVSPPDFFVDEQRHGPFSFWHHQHHLKKSTAGTRITDEVHYRLPGGPIGILVHALIVRRKLEAIFDFRHDVCREIFSA